MERAGRSRGDPWGRKGCGVYYSLRGRVGRAASFIACFLGSRNAPATPLERDMYIVTVLGLVGAAVESKLLLLVALT